MKRDWFPSNGRNLMLQRKRGVLPSGPVNVVLDLRDPDIGFAGTVLTLRSDDTAERIDWRMLVNLDVWVWADEGQPLDRVVSVVRDIVDVSPRSLYLRFVDPQGNVHDVDCGTGTHRPGAPRLGIPAEHTFLFCPVNSAGSRLGRELCRALSRINPER